MTEDLTAQLEVALSRSVTLEGRNQLLEQFVGLQTKLLGSETAVRHSSVWWLDDVTRQMIDQRLSLDSTLTFTLRGGRPITLTRQQVRPPLPPLSHNSTTFSQHALF